MHQNFEEENNKYDAYKELNDSFYKALDIYFQKETNREMLLHNSIMSVATYGINNGCTLPEVLGSMDTAMFELKHIAFFGDEEEEENDE